MLEPTLAKLRIVIIAAGAVALLGASAAEGAAPELTSTEGAPRAAEAAAVRVWYRSSEGCPDGAAFVALLARLQRSISLAGVGDHVDFVVTLAFSPQQSGGRLERQSSQGTVAIRGVTASSCQEVAEVLALSLDLALQPEQEQEPSAPKIAVSADAPVWDARFGAQATLTTGLAGAVLPGAALFFDVRPDVPPWSGRVSLRGALGERDAVVGLSIGLLTSRLEGCWGWQFGSLDAGPCVGLDLGLVYAEGAGNTGRSDTGVWSSAGVSARVGWQVGRSVSLEAQAGLLVPFVRYRFSAVEGGDVSSSAPLGFDAALACSFLL